MRTVSPRSTSRATSAMALWFLISLITTRWVQPITLERDMTSWHDLIMFSGRHAEIGGASNVMPIAPAPGRRDGRGQGDRTSAQLSDVWVVLAAVIAGIGLMVWRATGMSA